MQTRRDFLKIAGGVLASAALGVAIPNSASAVIISDCYPLNPDEFFAKFDPNNTGRVSINHVVEYEMREAKGNSPQMENMIRGVRFRCYKPFDSGNGTITRKSYTDEYNRVYQRK